MNAFDIANPTPFVFNVSSACEMRSGGEPTGLLRSIMKSFTNNGLCGAYIKVGLEAGTGCPLDTVIRPEHRSYTRLLMKIKWFLPGMCQSKGVVACRMPVLGQDYRQR